MNGFLFRFFCFFTDHQPHIYLSAAEKIKNFFIFQYALVSTQSSVEENISTTEDEKSEEEVENEFFGEGK